ncbi:hypothetical protein ACP26L_05510 [Paenibacillus sp. S-38]|uniref:hypothetical protein n=1 Tax=Paenibacillus sp. S-38 TaxID=3416710 RepID=UPI003CEE4669
MTPNKGSAAAGVFSFVFSLIASSHHWIHMGILFVLGGSTNMMSTVTGIRRFMITATLATAFFSLYSLLKHPHRKRSATWVTFASTLLSLGLVAYTLLQMG